jgi:hypothetical protein
MVEPTLLAFIVFLSITLAYYLILSFSGQGFNSIFTVAYFLLVIFSQLFIAFRITQNLCGGSGQFIPVVLWGLIPWIMIFIGLNIILMILPGWKAPFSNTFGYLASRVAGVNSVMDTLVKSGFSSKDVKLNKIMETIYEDNSLLVNQITPENFNVAVQKLSGIFDKSNMTVYNAAITKLKSIVFIKDLTSRVVWYLLTGLLSISISNMGLLSSVCTKSPEQIKDEVTQYHAQLQSQTQQATQKQSTQKSYFVRD